MKILFVLDYVTFKSDTIKTALMMAPHVDIIWLRIKQLEALQIVTLASSLRKKLPNTTLILSDRADIASFTGFNGVHLGHNSISPVTVKSCYPSLTVGYSAHSLDEMTSVSADYYTLSPLFFTQKEYDVKPIGPQVITHLNKTIYALGGINSQNLDQIRHCGFTGIAGISFYKEIEKIGNRIKGFSKEV